MKGVYQMETHEMPLGGIWSITLIMVVIASWILYKYLAPKGFKEWRNAGLVQAFIIALYAEMYGFPLTIYFLTSFLDLDIPWIHIKGHLWSSLFGLDDNFAVLEMFLGYAFIVLGLSMLFKGWFQIYKAQKMNELVADGIYGYVRHPQYTGIFLALIGQLIHWPTIPTLFLFPVILIAYYRLSRFEERKMTYQFDYEYNEYIKSVPMFFPKWEKMKITFQEL